MAFIIIISIYAVFILLLLIGFRRLPRFSESKNINSISVIIPVRDEPNVNELLSDLSQQQYPDYEVIIVDDHSAVPVPNSIPNKGHGKKSAIVTGITSAKGDIIVTTDGDCRVPPGWLRDINNGFQDPNIKMLVGGVKIEEDHTFFSKLQSLEFVSVAVTGAATLGFGYPTMCNGANLSYRKSAFYEVHGFAGNESVSSGDDEFLMNKFDKKSIAYSNSVVSTKATGSFSDFINQRLRWAGKWSVNTSVFTRVFAVTVFCFHMAFIAAILSFNWKILLAKAIAEMILLFPAARFYRVKFLFIPFIVLQLVHPFYVVITGLLSQVVLPKWKGRVVETKV